jgi:hypothetical protein
MEHISTANYFFGGMLLVWWGLWGICGFWGA